MKKFIIFIMIITMLFIAGCDVLLEALEEYETDQSEDTVLITAEPKQENANSGNTSTEYTYDGMPTLPNIDFENLDLFDDGYQIVEFDHAPDGDTAIFVVSGSYLKTRFLGVDTTEMSTDSGIPEDWAQQGKDFTNDMLQNADEIILELDENCDAFDNYDRLLAWIWVDGQLLNYMLAARGFADVKYLYDDYKYNDDLLDAEYIAQSRNLGIWGDDEPHYNPNDNISVNSDSSDDYITISEARQKNHGAIVKVKGVVTNMIENNAFIEDDTAGIYIYTNNKKFSALSVGTEVIIEGKLADYNGFLEITDFTGSDIRIVSSDNSPLPKTVTASQIGEELEGQYVKIENAEITYIDYKSGEKGYSIFVIQNGHQTEIRVDKHLTSYPDPQSFNEGNFITVIGNVAQHHDNYQIMISGEDAIS